MESFNKTRKQRTLLRRHVLQKSTLLNLVHKLLLDSVQYSYCRKRKTSRQKGNRREFESSSCNSKALLKNNFCCKAQFPFNFT